MWLITQLRSMSGAWLVAVAAVFCCTADVLFSVFDGAELHPTAASNDAAIRASLRNAGLRSEKDFILLAFRLCIRSQQSSRCVAGTGCATAPSARVMHNRSSCSVFQSLLPASSSHD